MLLELAFGLLLCSAQTAAARQEPVVLTGPAQRDPLNISALPGGMINWGSKDVWVYWPLLEAPQMIKFTAPGQTAALWVKSHLRNASRTYYYGAWDATGSSWGTRYETDDHRVATIDKEGVVTARGPGFTFFRVRHWGEMFLGFLRVSPENRLKFTELMRGNAVRLRFPGDSTRLIAEGRFTDGETGDLGGFPGMTFSVDDTTVAAVDSAGVIYGVAAGRTVARAKYATPEGTLTATADVEVDISSKNAVRALAIGPSGQVLRRPGDRVTLWVTGTCANGQSTTLTPSLLGTKYRSSNPAAIEVSSEGVVTARGAGAAEISAFYGSLSTSTLVVSRPTRLVSLEMQPNSGRITYAPDLASVLKLRLIGRFSDGSVDDVARPELGSTYASNDERVAQVNGEGLVIALETGNVKITAKNHGLKAVGRFRVNRFSPTPLGWLPGEGFSGVAVSSAGAYAYIAAGAAGWKIADLKDPARPKLLETRRTKGRALDALTAGSRLFIVRDSGIDAYETRVSSAHPHAAGSVEIPGVSAAAILRGRLYVSARDALEIRDARSLKLLGRAAGLGGNPGAVAVSGRTAFAGEGSSLLIFDVSAPSSPKLAGKVTLQGPVRHVAARGGIAYAVIEQGEYSRIETVDAREPAKAVVMAPLGIQIFTKAAPAISGDWLLTTGGGAEQEKSLMATDISQPYYRDWIGGVTFPKPFTGSKVVASGHRAYILSDSDQPGLHIASMDLRFDAPRR